MGVRPAPWNPPGTGVGLAIVHKVVQRHGGTVGIQDNPVGGTRLIFTIPHADLPRRPFRTGPLMKEGRAISNTEHHPRPTGTAGTAVPIRLVEDNPGDIRLTREALRGCGITDPKMKVTTAPVSGGRLELHGRERYARVGLSVQAAGSRVTL